VGEVQCEVVEDVVGPPGRMAAARATARACGEEVEKDVSCRPVGENTLSSAPRGAHRVVEEARRVVGKGGE
jgi:hypothetical protein